MKNFDRIVEPILAHTKTAKYQPYYFNNPELTGSMASFENLDLDKDNSNLNLNAKKKTTTKFHLDIHKSNSKIYKENVIEKSLNNSNHTIKEENQEAGNIDRWYKIISYGDKPIERYSCISFIHEDEFFIGLGKNFNEKINSRFLHKIKIDNNSNFWYTIEDIKGEYPMIESGAKSVKIDNKVYVFGGFINSIQCSSLVYCLDIPTLTWSILGGFSKEGIATKSVKEIPTNINSYSSFKIYEKLYQHTEDPLIKLYSDFNNKYPELQLSGHVMVYSSLFNGLIIHGGLINNKHFNKKTFLFDFGSEKWQTLISPGLEDKIGEKYIVNLKTENWAYNHAGAITDDHVFYIFGGIDINHKHSDSVYRLDLQKLKSTLNEKEENFNNLYLWEKVETKNNGLFDLRCNHSADYFNKKFFIFGGKTNTMQECNSFIYFNIETNEYSEIHPNLLEVPVGLESEHIMKRIDYGRSKL